MPPPSAIARPPPRANGPPAAAPWSPRRAPGRILEPGPVHRSSLACNLRSLAVVKKGTAGGSLAAATPEHAGRYRRTMAASTGGSGICTGRAVSVRHEDEVTDLPGRAGATILIASPGCWSSPEHTIAMITACGIRVVISAGLSHIIYNTLINVSIVPVALPAKTVTKLQETVESDPGIVLTVDAGRGELRARGALLARFEIPGPRPARPADDANSRAGGGEAMARRLLMAQRLLGSASLPGEVRVRFQRRLVAICDAMKAPGADAGRGARRLDRLLIELARTGQPGLAQAKEGRARDLGRRSGLDGGRRAP